MPNYICNNCLKEFKQKSHYDKHIYNKKKPCNPPNIHLGKLDKVGKNLPNLPEMTNLNNTIIPEKVSPPTIILTNDKDCNYCKKTFVDKYSLKKHLTRCKIKKQEDAKINENAMLKEEIAILKQQMSEIMNKPQIINNNNTNNNITNNDNKNIVVNNNINIIAFDKVDVNNLSEAELKEFLTKIY